MGVGFDLTGVGNTVPMFGSQGGLAINYYFGLGGATNFSFVGGSGAAGGLSMTRGPQSRGPIGFRHLRRMYPFDCYFHSTGNTPITEGNGYFPADS